MNKCCLTFLWANVEWKPSLDEQMLSDVPLILNWTNVEWQPSLDEQMLSDVPLILNQRRMTALNRWKNGVWRSSYADPTLDDIPLLQSQRVMTILNPHRGANAVYTFLMLKRNGMNVPLMLSQRGKIFHLRWTNAEQQYTHVHSLFAHRGTIKFFNIYVIC